MDDEFKTLEIINFWIANCDTKTSILLAIYGVVLSLSLSSDKIRLLRNIVVACFATQSMGNVLYFIFLLTSIGIFFFGLYKLIRVLLPKIDLQNPSVMFFGSVARIPSLNEYKLKVDTISDEELHKDLLGQIYAAAKICNQKFQNQKAGLLFSMVGLMLFAILVLLGTIVFPA